ISKEYINSVLEKYQLDPTRPLVTQISRFDYLKDPVGVIDAFKLAKARVDCQLVLAGGWASDDPESAQVLNEVKEHAGNDPDIHILVLPPFSDLEINALQRASTIVLQKSLREGFGLTVTEALWKGKPVIASAVGGIPLQIRHNVTGILVHSIEGTAYHIRNLIQNPDLAEPLGKVGKEHVRNKFLLTRNLKDYLILLNIVSQPGKKVLELP
ncbi:MAG: glycosyltransferase, partial [bacterium]